MTGATTGYTRLDDAAQSFADRQATPLFTVTTDPDQAADGQWLATALGIDPSVLQPVHAAGGLDQARARAMQRALWPATLGYLLDKLLAPTFDDQTVAELRAYFSSYVRGRGALPAIRIGGQAYGVLPTTAFSRIGWLGQSREGTGQPFLAGLLRVLRLVQADWAGLAQGVSRVGSGGDAHQILLDILGLHPDSAEYYWRYSQGLTELYNVVNLWGLGPQFWTALVELGLRASGTALLSRLGDPNPDPDLLQHAFFTESGLIGTIVDDRPASETDAVRFYTDDHRNYLQWLADTAATSLDDVVAERGFSGDVSPQALLYLYIRHAILLGYYDTSYNLHRSAGFLTAEQLAAMKPEAPFIHVDATATVSESRYAALYKTEARITGSPTELVGRLHHEQPRRSERSSRPGGPDRRAAAAGRRADGGARAAVRRARRRRDLPAGRVAARPARAAAGPDASGRRSAGRAGQRQGRRDGLLISALTRGWKTCARPERR